MRKKSLVSLSLALMMMSSTVAFAQEPVTVQSQTTELTQQTSAQLPEQTTQTSKNEEVENAQQTLKDSEQTSQSVQEQTLQEQVTQEQTTENESPETVFDKKNTDNTESAVMETEDTQITEEQESVYYADNVSGMLEYTLNYDKEVVIIGLSDAAASKENINIIIPDKINGKPVAEIKSYAFYGNVNIKSVSLNSNLKKIGSNAFDGCVNLDGVMSIPSNVTSIEDSAFKGTSVSKIVFKDGTSPLTIGYSAFYNCKNLSSVEFPARIKSIGNNAFGGDSSLSNITFKDGDISLTIGSYVFSDASFKKLILPKNTESIGYGAFNNNVELTSIILNEGIKTIGDEAFKGCNNLSGTLNIPSSVGDIGDRSFLGTAITKLVIKDGNKALKIGSKAFQDCKVLTGVSLSNRISNIGSSAFNGDASLTDVNFSETAYNLDIESYAFYGISAKEIKLPKKTKSIGYDAFEENSELTKIELNEGLETIGSSAFKNCFSLYGVLTIPSTVTSIGYSAFQNTDLFGVVIKDGNASIYLGNDIFSGCKKLVYADLSNRVKEIGEIGRAHV